MTVLHRSLSRRPSRRPRVRVATITLLALFTGLVGCGRNSSSSDTSDGTDPATSQTSTDAGVDGATSDGATDSGSEASPTDSVAPGTFTVGTMEVVFTDDTRPTTAHGDRPELPSRTLRTVVYYPSGPADGTDIAPAEPGAPRVAGPWPTIIFAHGSTRKAEDYSGTLTRWASAGYVVVAPNFPLSTEGTAGGTLYSDYPSQTADVSFLVDAMTTDDASALELAKLVDRSRIGMGGQSFGAITTLGTVAAECCAEPRIRAATEFAGMFLPYPSGTELSPGASSVPVLFFHGDDDPTVPYASDHDFWVRLGAPGGFITIIGGAHDDGYFDGDTVPLDQLVADLAITFYDEHLKGDATASGRFSQLLDDGADLVSFEPSN